MEIAQKVIQEFTNDKVLVEEALAKCRDGGGTNIVGALESAIDEILLEKDDREKMIILLTDGEDSNFTRNVNEIIDRAKEEKIIVYGIGLQAVDSQENPNFEPVKQLAEETKGKFYTIQNVNLEDIFVEIANYELGVEDKDTDGDGIPDGIEIAGMRNQWGTIIYTDPTKADSDGDGISDKEEMGEIKVGEDGKNIMKCQ